MRDPEVVQRLTRIESRLVRLAGALGHGDTVKMSNAAPVVTVVSPADEAPYLQVEMPSYDTAVSDVLKALERAGQKGTSLPVFVSVRGEDIFSIRFS